MKDLVLLLLTVLSPISGDVFADSWHKYIVGPQQRQVFPTAVVATTGDVVDASALIDGGRVATLTRRPGDAPASVTLDFGVNTVGFLQIAFAGASSNSPGLRLAFSETLQFLSDLSDFSRSNMGSPITPGSDQIAVAPGAYEWQDTWGCRNSTQVCSDGLHGFRYVKIYLDALESDAPITQASGTVNITSVSLNYSGFLATPDTFLGWFECSDQQLNEFWYEAVYTNDMTTDVFRETDVDPRGAFSPSLDGQLVLFDGAKRDRDPYVGDVAVSGLTGYLSHFNLTSVAARNVLADLALHQTSDGYIPSASVMNYTLMLFDYPLWWIVAVNDYVRLTNDTDFLSEYFPNMRAALDNFYPAHTNQASNLLSRPAGYGDYAFVGRDGEASYYNVLYVWALKLGAECAGWLDNSEAGEEWLQRAATVSDAVNALFWDEEVGAYINSVATPTHPQDANAIAVLAGVADTERAISALTYLQNHTSLPYGNAFMDDNLLVDGGSERVYAFMSTFDLRARMEVYTLGRSAIEEMKRLYGWMQSHDPFSTYWEGIGSGGSHYQGGFTSAAHGWSTGVVGVLTNYVLGIQTIDPRGEWQFSYVECGLDWARGQYPLPDGNPIGLQWGQVNETFTATLDAPEGTHGSVRLPRGEDIDRVLHNTEEVWSDGRPRASHVRLHEDGRLVLEGLEAGQHTITATYNTMG